MDTDSGTPPLLQQKPLTRLRDRVVIMAAIGVVSTSVFWALRDPPATQHKIIEETAARVLIPETISLVTGDESLVDIFTRPGCPVCHKIPGIPGADGQVGPPLVLGTTGEQRLKDPGYSGQAKTVHEYIVESVLDPQRFVVRGYLEHTMPDWYGSRLSALALEKMASYLERQTEERSVR